VSISQELNLSSFYYQKVSIYFVLALPSEETYKYMKFICSLYENIQNEKNKEAVEVR
jgi:hypothetical protein